MIVTISKRFTFDAAHYIPTFPETHPCRRMHGHTYAVELVLKGHVNSSLGYFIDYADIAKAWQPLHDLLDHRVLNEVLNLPVPTTEMLCLWIVRELRQRAGTVAVYLDRVRVFESSSTWCELDANEPIP